MHSYLWLASAIFAEIISTITLKFSEGFSRPIPSIIVCIGYGFAFYALSHSLKTIPIGVAYAIWSGIGTAAIAMIGWLFLRQPLNTTAIIGFLLIIVGVILLQLNSPH